MIGIIVKVCVHSNDRCWKLISYPHEHLKPSSSKRNGGQTNKANALLPESEQDDDQILNPTFTTQ